MKVFSFFVEPSSYTLDLISNVFMQLNIDHAFLRSSSHAKASIKTDITALDKFKVVDQIKYIIKIYRNYDMIIFNGYNHWQFFLSFILNTLNTKKRVIAIESDTRFRERKGLKAILKKFYLTPIFSRRYVFGFPGGNFTHKELFRHYGMKDENIFLMPMMVDNSKFYTDSERVDKPFVFLFVGRMIPLKQIEFLIQSFLKNFENSSEVLLRLVGDGELYDPLFSKYGKYENILFEGAKYGEELVKSYHSSHILILPSDREQWGLVVNEAMAAGLPVIASDQVGAIYDLIIGKETGFVFSLNKENDLADKMLKLYEDKELYAKYSQNAKKLMKEEWNYDLYRSCLEKAIRRAEEILQERKRN